MVSAEFKSNGVWVTLENISGNDVTRSLRVRLPKGTTRLSYSEKEVSVKDGWAMLPAVKLPAKGRMVLTFKTSS